MAKKPIPAILSGHALVSLRDSGYSLATALAEVVDNSIEAKANNIRIIYSEDKAKNGKRFIKRIAFLDDGVGMAEDVLHHYPQLGFSTRFGGSDHNLGKYGLGAKLAAFNFGARIEIWSRQKKTQSWLYSYLDLDEAFAADEKGEEVQIAPPKERALPKEFELYLEGTSGTLILWDKLDRLERRAGQKTEEEIDECMDELSRIFRHYIAGGIKIFHHDMNRELLAHDPLMSLSGTWADHVLNQNETARIKGDPKSKVPKHFEPLEEFSEEIDLESGKQIELRVTLLPFEAIQPENQGGNKLAKKLHIPDNEGKLSFVRLDREISYTTVPKILPSGVHGEDRYIGIEVRFKPDLDVYFGVRNVKRGVEPDGEVRQALRQRLETIIPALRKKIRTVWGKKEEKTTENEQNPGVMATLVEADLTLPKSKVVFPENANTDEIEKKALEQFAEDVEKKTPEEKKDLYDKVKDSPYIIATVDFPGNQLFEIEHLPKKISIRFNRRHPYYREFLAPLDHLIQEGSTDKYEQVQMAKKMKDAFVLLITAYAKGESMHRDPDEAYSELRGHWGTFLTKFVTIAKRTT